jgi:hypothetical protein
MLYHVVRRAEDTKGVIRIRKSKDRQLNGQKKKDNMFLPCSCSAMAVIAAIADRITHANEHAYQRLSNFTVGNK